MRIWIRCSWINTLLNHLLLPFQLRVLRFDINQPSGALAAWLGLSSLYCILKSLPGAFPQHDAATSMSLGFFSIIIVAAHIN